jgi:hypothetical protein
MTSSSIVDKAATSGTDTITEAPPAEREHGIARVQEELVYYVTGLAESALYEAERLMYGLKNTAMRRTSDHDGSKGTEPIDMGHVVMVVSETLDCIDVAAEQLSRLCNDVRIRQDERSLSLI